MPKLYAIADLHVGHKQNAEALTRLGPGRPGDGLILCGDLGEIKAHMEQVFKKATACYDRVFWVPGNHELYTMSAAGMPTSTAGWDNLRGEAKYMACVELAREWGVRTPEDPWETWTTGPSGSTAGHGDDEVEFVIALCFGLYDYSFRPAEVTRDGALDWAREGGIEATDEAVLHADPHPTRDAWCHQLCDRWEAKFRDAAARWPRAPFVIVNHWPLRQDTIHIPLVPRFTLWCGTTRTADWHQKDRFGAGHPGAHAVVTGHLHVRRTDWIDGTRFEECSLGYPRQWKVAREDHGRDINDMLREILPGPEKPLHGAALGTQWRSLG